MAVREIPPQHPPWGKDVPLSWVSDGDPEYADLITQLRGFLDELAGSRPAPAESAALADALRTWRRTLRQTWTGEEGQVFGRRPDLPSRGHTMLPDYVVHRIDEDQVSATVRFGRFYLGGGEAVHGGAIPLVFDELLGTLTNYGRRPAARTVHLEVDFRSLTPLDVDLELTGRIEGHEGRKTYVSGRLTHGERLCAQASAIFVEFPDAHRVTGGREP